MTPQDLIREAHSADPSGKVRLRGRDRRWRIAAKRRDDTVRVRAPAQSSALALRDAGDEGFVQLLRMAGL